jgi:ribosomal protein L7/L12
MSSTDPEEKARRIREALFRGNKIEAIKLYRAEAGVDLATAKGAVEKLEAELRASSPEAFQSATAAGGKGCFSVLIASASAGALLWRVVIG